MAKRTDARGNGVISRSANPIAAKDDAQVMTVPQMARPGCQRDDVSEDSVLLMLPVCHDH